LLDKKVKEFRFSVPWSTIRQTTSREAVPETFFISALVDAGEASAQFAAPEEFCSLPTFA